MAFLGSITDDPCKYQNCDLQQILFHNICTCNAILVKFPHVPQNKADSPKMKMEKKKSKK